MANPKIDAALKAMLADKRKRSIDELSEKERAKLAKLEHIADTLRRGKNVQNRMLQTWLSEAEFAQIYDEWDAQLEFRQYYKDKPDVIVEYERKVKAATLYSNRRDGYFRKGNKTAAYACDAKCESLCEDAIELLSDLLDRDPSLQQWFDRAISFEAGSDIDANLASLPRVVTSRSTQSVSAGMHLMTKNEVKLGVVERAISATKRSDT